MARKRIPKRKKDWEDDTEEIVKTEPDLRRADKENDETDDYFPFLKLIPEIRDMIYECLLVSKATEPIQLDESGGEFTPGGIETAILRTNRAVCIAQFGFFDSFPSMSVVIQPQGGRIPRASPVLS